MIRCFSVLAILALALKLSAAVTNSPAPPKIDAFDAGKYYGQEMIVTGKVAQVTIRPRVVLINLNQPYPHTPLTLVIFPQATNQFGNLEALVGKSVEAKGKINCYNHKPEITLKSTNQLKVISPTN